MYLLKNVILLHTTFIPPATPNYILLKQKLHVRVPLQYPTYSGNIQIKRSSISWSISKSYPEHQCCKQSSQKDDTKHTEHPRGPKLNLSGAPPGTTSLVIRLHTGQSAEIRKWIRDWTRDYVFSSQGVTPVPLSLSAQGSATVMNFYSVDGEVRGSLSFSATSDDNVLVRLTSTSRFLNKAGIYTSYLPGERRIVRTFVSDIRYRFRHLYRVSIIYKAPHIRLRHDGSRTSLADEGTSIIVFVAEFYEAATSSAVIEAVRQWALHVQYGITNVGPFAKGRLPPISSKFTERGVIVFMPTLTRSPWISKAPASFDDSKESTITVSVRDKNKRSSDLIAGSYQSMMNTPNKVLLLVSAVFPDETATRIVLKR